MNSTCLFATRRWSRRLWHSSRFNLQPQDRLPPCREFRQYWWGVFKQFLEFHHRCTHSRATVKEGLDEPPVVVEPVAIHSLWTPVSSDPLFSGYVHLELSHRRSPKQASNGRVIFKCGAISSEIVGCEATMRCVRSYNLIFSFYFSPTEPSWVENKFISLMCNIGVFCFSET